MRKAGGMYMAVLRGSGPPKTPSRGIFKEKCRGGVSGGSGEDHVGSNAKAARTGRRRRIRMKAIFVMGAAYKREHRGGQASVPIPKFARVCRTLRSELRNRRTLANL